MVTPARTLCGRRLVGGGGTRGGRYRRRGAPSRVWCDNGSPSRPTEPSRRLVHGLSDGAPHRCRGDRATYGGAIGGLDYTSFKLRVGC